MQPMIDYGGVALTNVPCALLPLLVLYPATSVNKLWLFSLFSGLRCVEPVMA
jgi:hypothetical protein